MSSNLILFNKPFRVMSQFSEEGDKSTLADFIQAPYFYPAGRLDFDSEGLLLLTDKGALQHIIASPDFKLPKTYWVQVEGNITNEALIKLRQGVDLKDGLTKPAQAKHIEEPNIWPRNPAVRHRENIPTSWLELQIKEGKNRQVRRMTAAVGFPTLRLIRYAIGPYSIDNTTSGEWCFIEPTDELLQEVHNFEQKRKNKTSPPHRRSTRTKGRPVPDGERVSRQPTSTKPARRTHRK
ncbi:pseudouridine synthase [Marinomonas sp. C2222]|uniref:Pseudouridine synthase n=1 Tax=Marinomonas sargassi TaxID=2984494 RepID=A0ABT2YN46_9GAMM|nr:pseudouridine synthase [Marinomonas sargassi]MCV2401312.1 pseudouridine synthase [Marinomonas sargassi]